MFQSTGLIQPLPKEVAGKIESSVAISSLHQVVCGLLENALEAQADVVDVSVDFQLGSCVLEDNGVGIPPHEFKADGGLCKPYHTSKLNGEFAACPKAGIFLASLASLSTLTVTSHHHAHKLCATLVTHQSNPAARLVPAPTHHTLAHRAHGTKVTVRDLFGALPVRAKHRALSRELFSVRQKDWHSLRHAVTAVLLAWNRPVSLTMRTSDNTQKVRFGRASQLVSKNVGLVRTPDTISFDIDVLRGILVQGGQCDSDSWDTWCKVSARTPALTIRAIISKQAAPSRFCQFISLGSQVMGNNSGFNVLYDEINRIFASSSFGVDEELRVQEDEQVGNRKKSRLENGGYTHKELKGRGKGTDRWPMFYIRIESRRSSEFCCLQSNDGSPEGGKALQLIIEVLHSLMTRFLFENHYLVHAKRSRPKELSHQGSRPPSAARVNTKDKSRNNILRDDTPSQTCEPPIQGTKQRNDLASDKLNKKRLSTPRKKGDLESTVILPKPPTINLGIGKEISGWSRIKAARAVDLPISRNITPYTSDALVIAPDQGDGMNNVVSSLGAIESTDAFTARVVPVFESMPSSAGSIDLTHRLNDTPCDRNVSENCTSGSEQVNPYGDTIADTDDSLKWTHPLTKAQVIINRRTGLLMADPHQPAASAIAIGSPLTLSRDRSTKKCKLLRANTEPSRLPAVDTWARKLLCSWENPIFAQNEDNIKQVSPSVLSGESGQILSGRYVKCTHHEIEKAFSESSAAFSAKISAPNLANSTVLGQLDKKFILVKSTAISSMNQDANAIHESQMLVLVDQHAADERYGVEALLRALCSPPSSQSSELQTVAGLNSAIDTTMLAKPIIISVTVREWGLFKSYAKHFANWGILIEFSPQTRGQASPPGAPMTTNIQILSLPPSIAERCRSDVKHLAEMLREEVWRLEELGPQAVAIPARTNDDAEPESWINRIRTCPPGILNMLNSRACRSAIMFNDELTLEECEVLTRRLAQCSFPFQCAHGRPTMIPLVDIGTRDDELGENDGVRLGRSLFVSDRGENDDRFVDAWKSWRAREVGMEST